MAQITEFFVNLLLLRRNFLITTAADTIHEAVKKCMNYKRKISIEYDSALQMVGPFDNMLEFINYTASQYKSEGENYVVTSEVQYRLYEELSKLASPETIRCIEDTKNAVNSQVNMVLASPSFNEKVKIKEKGKNFSTTSNLNRRDDDQDDKRKIKNQNYIIENLHAILKSQELLFKNIVKLIHILEKDAKLNINAKKLEQIRNKLSTCTDVLSQNSPTSQKFSDLINNIIEEEITRCRFRHGESKTSREICLKIPKPEGIAAALKPAKKRSTAEIKNKDEHNKEEIRKEIKTEYKPNIIKLDRQKESLNRKEIESEVRKNSAKFIKEPIPNVIKIDRRNEILRRNEIKKEVEKYSMNIIKQSKIIKFNQQNEVLSRNKIDAEARSRSNNFVKRAKSESTMRLLTINPKNNEKRRTKCTSASDALNESKKLIETNEEHFHQFENALWHSLTTTKFMSIRDDYQNQNKCAFHNKRQFLAFESALSQQSKERAEENDNIEKFLSVSETMFQILERKLFSDELKEKMRCMHTASTRNDKPEVTVVKPALVKENHSSTDQDKSSGEIKTSKEINIKQPKDGEKSNFEQVLTTLKKNIAASTPPKARIIIKRPTETPSPIQNNKIKTEIKKTSALPMKEKNFDEATKHHFNETQEQKKSQLSVANLPEKNILNTTEHGKIIIDSYKNVRNKEDKKVVKIMTSRLPKAIKEITKSKQAVESAALEKKKEKIRENQASGTKENKIKSQEFTGLKVKLDLFKIIKNTGSLKNQERLALQVVAKSDGKLLNIQGALPSPEKKTPKKSLSDVQLKDEAALIEMNKKAFDEMESTLHTVRNFINKHPVIINSTTSIKRAGNKHTPDEPTKKNLSTKAFITVTSRQALCNCNKMTKRKTHILSRGDCDEAHTSVSTGKTFVKETENIQSASSEDSRSDEEMKYLYSEKSRTFLKSATQQIVEARRLKHTLTSPITKISHDHNFLQMRRTTKTVMKKQQVLTILPKLSTTNYKRNQSKEGLTEKNESKITISNKDNEINNECN